jgi:hypothetical protein
VSNLLLHLQSSKGGILKGIFIFDGVLVDKSRIKIEPDVSRIMFFICMCCRLCLGRSVLSTWVRRPSPGATTGVERSVSWRGILLRQGHYFRCLAHCLLLIFGVGIPIFFIETAQEQVAIASNDLGFDEFL